MEGPRREEIARIGDLTGRRPTGFRRAAGGYTPAERWVVELEGGDRVFAKIGVDSRTAGWLRDNAPMLVAAEDEASIDGPCPAHLDVRSDNLCFRGGRAVLVDWNHAVVAHPDLDIAGWAPSLHAEGGPAPEEILPGAGPLAAVISGYFADRAGQPVIPTAPRVREVQLRQLRTALPWAARALGLPPLDGPASQPLTNGG